MIALIRAKDLAHDGVCGFASRMNGSNFLMSSRCNRDRRRVSTDHSLCSFGGVPTDRNPSCAACEFPLVVIKGLGWNHPRNRRPRRDIGSVGELIVEFGNAGRMFQQSYHVQVLQACTPM